MLPLRTILFTYALFPTLLAAAQSAQTDKEIRHLLQFVERSGCLFNRNGQWHEGAKAYSHLAKKYDYLSQKEMIKNAEDFIELAASRSSVSGKAYSIKCGNADAIPSKQWLYEELIRYRKASTK